MSLALTTSMGYLHGACLAGIGWFSLSAAMGIHMQYHNYIHIRNHSVNHVSGHILVLVFFSSLRFVAICSSPHVFHHKKLLARFGSARVTRAPKAPTSNFYQSIAMLSLGTAKLRTLLLASRLRSRKVWVEGILLRKGSCWESPQMDAHLFQVYLFVVTKRQ